MKVRILSSGFNDLVAGRDFYEKQEEGLGAYFLNSLFSDIDSLVLYAGIHGVPPVRLWLLANRPLFSFDPRTPTGSRVARYELPWVIGLKKSYPNVGCIVASQFETQIALTSSASAILRVSALIRYVRLFIGVRLLLTVRFA